MAESALYQPILLLLQEHFAQVGFPADLEIAAITGASDKISQRISPGQEILFSFLPENKPDILGTLQDSRWISAEIKEGPLGLDHIYQAKRYKELFGARCAFLITAERIPARLRRLCIALPQILHASNDAYSFFVLAEFKRDPSEPSNGAFVDWFPADPFANSVYWR